MKHTNRTELLRMRPPRSGPVRLFLRIPAGMAAETAGGLRVQNENQKYSVRISVTQISPRCSPSSTQKTSPKNGSIPYVRIVRGAK